MKKMPSYNRRNTVPKVPCVLYLSVRMRLKSVTNIQKITKSMKMVSAAKYSKAERDLKSARPYGAGAQGKKSLHCSGWY